MDFFEDLANKGEIYSALEKQGLIRKLFDYDCIETLEGYGWELGIDLEDSSECDKLSSKPFFIIYYGIGSQDTKDQICECYPPLVKGPSHHDHDFLMVNCEEKSVALFGLGRKNKAFAKSSFNNSEFERGVEKFGSSLPYDLATIFDKQYEQLGHTIYQIEILPGSVEDIEYILETEPDDDGYYWLDDWDEGFTEQSLKITLHDYASCEEEIAIWLEAMISYFPNIEIADLDTEDY